MRQKRLIWWNFLSHHLEGVTQEQSLPWYFIPNWEEALVLANIVDANKDEWILGTVAGANTFIGHLSRPARCQTHGRSFARFDER